MTYSGHPVCKHPIERQTRAVGREPVSNRTEGLRHRLRIDDSQHRHTQELREISATRCTVEQSHHPFDQDQVGFTRGLVQESPAVFLASHPQIELVRRASAGALENHGVEEVRAGLEHADDASLRAVEPSERGRDSCLALVGSRSTDEQRGTGTALHDQNSTPACALTPCSL